MQLKTLRTEKGSSLDQTAKETGISKAMLGRIERGRIESDCANAYGKLPYVYRASLSAFLPAERAK